MIQWLVGWLVGWLVDVRISQREESNEYFTAVVRHERIHDSTPVVLVGAHAAFADRPMVDRHQESSAIVLVVTSGPQKENRGTGPGLGFFLNIEIVCSLL